MGGTPQHRRQVKTETVDTELADPKAQRIEHELGDARMGAVERIAAAAEVLVAAVVVTDQAVPALVVEAPKADRRAEFIAFGRVVVDHVEHHFQPMLMQRLHHLAEFLQHRARIIAVRSLCQPGIGAEKPQGVVAPVIVQTTLSQVRLVDAILDRQQRQRGHPQRFEMFNRRRRSQPCIGAAQTGCDTGMLHRKALHMDFVQHHIGRSMARRVQARAQRRQQGFGHPRLQGLHRVVAAVERAWPVRVALLVAMVFGLPAETAENLTRIGVEQQFMRVETVALHRLIRSMGAQAVDQPRAQARQETVEDAVMRAMQRVATQLTCARSIENAQLDDLSMFGKYGEIDTPIARHRTQRFMPAFLQFFGQQIHRAQAGTRKIVAKGGRVSRIDCSCCCAGWFKVGR